MSEERSALVRDFSTPLATGKGWMKFLGIVFIVQGAITALTIVGIIFAWLPIWIGVLLLQSASAIERAQLSGDEAALRQSLDKLRTYFVIQGVMMLIGLIIAVLAIVFNVALLGTVLSQMH